MTDAARPSPTTSDPELARAKAHASAEWARLRDRLETVTPAAVGRAVLGVGVVLAVVAFVVGTWPTLLPFAIGGLLRGSDVIVHEVGIVRGAPGTAAATVQSYLGIFSPQRSTYQVRMQEELLGTGRASWDGEEFRRQVAAHLDRHAAPHRAVFRAVCTRLDESRA